MMSQGVSKRFVAALIVFMIGLLLHAKLGPVLEWRPDFVLAALVAFAFFLEFFELIFLIAIAVLFFNWQPAPQLEIFLLFLLPLGVFFIRKVIFALEGWLSALCSVFVAVAIFYGVSSFSLAIGRYDVLLQDLAASTAFGVVITHLFNYFYKEETA